MPDAIHTRNGVHGVVQPVGVRSNGTLTSSRRYLNFSKQFSVSDDTTNKEADIDASPPRARVYNSGNISLSNNTWVALTFDTERYDTDTCHSTSSNTDRLTAITAGTYAIGGCVEIAGTASGAGNRGLRIRLNGSTVIAETMIHHGTNAITARLHVSTDYVLAANDYVTLEAFQDSSVSVNAVAAGNYSPEFWFRRVSP